MSDSTPQPDEAELLRLHFSGAIWFGAALATLGIAALAYTGWHRRGHGAALARGLTAA